MEHVQNMKNSAAIKIEDLQQPENDTTKVGRCNILRTCSLELCKVQ